MHVRLGKKSSGGDGAVPVPGGPQQLLRGAREPGASAGRGGRAENQAHAAQRGRPALPGHEPPPARLPLPRTSFACCSGQAREPSDSNPTQSLIGNKWIGVRLLPFPAASCVYY